MKKKIVASSLLILSMAFFGLIGCKKKTTTKSITNKTTNNNTTKSNTNKTNKTSNITKTTKTTKTNTTTDSHEVVVNRKCYMDTSNLQVLGVDTHDGIVNNIYYSPTLSNGILLKAYIKNNKIEKVISISETDNKNFDGLTVINNGDEFTTIKESFCYSRLAQKNYKYYITIRVSNDKVEIKGLSGIYTIGIDGSVDKNLTELTETPIEVDGTDATFSNNTMIIKEISNQNLVSKLVLDDNLFDIISDNDSERIKIEDDGSISTTLYNETEIISQNVYELDNNGYIKNSSYIKNGIILTFSYNYSSNYKTLTIESENNLYEDDFIYPLSFKASKSKYDVALDEYNRMTSINYYDFKDGEYEAKGNTKIAYDTFGNMISICDTNEDGFMELTEYEFDLTKYTPVSYKYSTKYPFETDFYEVKKEEYVFDDYAQNVEYTLYMGGVIECNYVVNYDEKDRLTLSIHSDYYEGVLLDSSYKKVYAYDENDEEVYYALYSVSSKNTYYKEYDKTIEYKEYEGVNANVVTETTYYDDEDESIKSLSVVATTDNNDVYTLDEEYENGFLISVSKKYNDEEYYDLYKEVEDGKIVYETSTECEIVNGEIYMTYFYTFEVHDTYKERYHCDYLIDLTHFENPELIAEETIRYDLDTEKVLYLCGAYFAFDESDNKIHLDYTTYYDLDNEGYIETKEYYGTLNDFEIVDYAYINKYDLNNNLISKEKRVYEYDEYAMLISFNSSTYYSLYDEYLLTGKFICMHGYEDDCYVVESYDYIDKTHYSKTIYLYQDDYSFMYQKETFKYSDGANIKKEKYSYGLDQVHDAIITSVFVDNICNNDDHYVQQAEYTTNYDETIFYSYYALIDEQTNNRKMVKVGETNTLVNRSYYSTVYQIIFDDNSTEDVPIIKSITRYESTASQYQEYTLKSQYLNDVEAWDDLTNYEAGAVHTGSPYYITEE